MQYIHFTAKEREVLLDRLYLHDCLTEVFEGEYESEAVERAATQIAECWLVAGEVGREVLREAVEGSTYYARAHDAHVYDNMSDKEWRAILRRLKSIEKKMEKAGIPARFPRW